MKTTLKISLLLFGFLILPAIAQQVERPETGRKEFRQSVSPVRVSYVSNLEPMLGSPNPNIIYTMPQASERVWNPMALKIGSTKAYFYLKDSKADPNHSALGVPLWELFRYIEREPEKFEIVRVERVIVDPSSPGGSTQATLWFTYVDKQFVLPIR